MSEIDRVILMGKPHQEGHDEPADITIGYRHACLPRMTQQKMRIPWKVDTNLPPPSRFLLMITINMIVSIMVIGVINLIVIIL